MRRAGTVASLASATSGWMVPAPLSDSGKSTAVRDTVMTVAPASAKAVAIPRPRPRDAPTTIVVLLDMSFMVVMAVSPLRGFAVGLTRVSSRRRARAAAAFLLLVPRAEDVDTRGPRNPSPAPLGGVHSRSPSPPVSRARQVIAALGTGELAAGTVWRSSRQRPAVQDTRRGASTLRQTVPGGCPLWNVATPAAASCLSRQVEAVWHRGVGEGGDLVDLVSTQPEHGHAVGLVGARAVEHVGAHRQLTVGRSGE